MSWHSFGKQGHLYVACDIWLIYLACSLKWKCLMSWCVFLLDAHWSQHLMIKASLCCLIWMRHVMAVLSFSRHTTKYASFLELTLSSSLLLDDLTCIICIPLMIRTRLCVYVLKNDSLHCSCLLIIGMIDMNITFLLLF